MSIWLRFTELLPRSRHKKTALGVRARNIGKSMNSNAMIRNRRVHRFFVMGEYPVMEYNQ